MATERQKNKEIYWAWKSMKQRCLNPKCAAYKNYGGRGITVCEGWMTFEPFLMWCKENGWRKGLDLDRENNEMGYSPDNCRFVTRRANSNNRRKTAYITVNGIRKAESDWARDLGINPGTVKAWRIVSGAGYAEKRIQEALEGGYRAKNFRYGHIAKRVLLVEKNIEFESIAEAARCVGISASRISNAIKNSNGHTRRGSFRVIGERVCK